VCVCVSDDDDGMGWASVSQLHGTMQRRVRKSVYKLNKNKPTHTHTHT